MIEKTAAKITPMTQIPPTMNFNTSSVIFFILLFLIPPGWLYMILYAGGKIFFTSAIEKDGVKGHITAAFGRFCRAAAAWDMGET